jgi:hypothetical protein
VRACTHARCAHRSQLVGHLHVDEVPLAGRHAIDRLLPTHITMRCRTAHGDTRMRRSTRRGGRSRGLGESCTRRNRSDLRPCSCAPAVRSCTLARILPHLQPRRQQARRLFIRSPLSVLSLILLHERDGRRRRIRRRGDAIDAVTRVESYMRLRVRPSAAREEQLACALVAGIRIHAARAGRRRDNAG